MVLPDPWEKGPTGDSSFDNLPLGSLFWNLCMCGHAGDVSVWQKLKANWRALLYVCRAHCPLPTSPLVLGDPSTAASGLPVPAKCPGDHGHEGKGVFVREQSQGMVSTRTVLSGHTGLGDSPSTVFHVCFLLNNWNGEEHEYF